MISILTILSMLDTFKNDFEGLNKVKDLINEYQVVEYSYNTSKQIVKSVANELYEIFLTSISDSDNYYD